MWKENSTNIKDLPSMQLPSIRELTSRNSGGLLGEQHEAHTEPGPDLCHAAPCHALAHPCTLTHPPTRPPTHISASHASPPPLAGDLSSLGFKDFPSGNFREMLASLEGGHGPVLSHLREALGHKALAAHRDSGPGSSRQNGGQQQQQQQGGGLPPPPQLNLQSAQAAQQQQQQQGQGQQQHPQQQQGQQQQEGPSLGLGAKGSDRSGSQGTRGGGCGGC
jgi:hypothetical protein